MSGMLLTAPAESSDALAAKTRTATAHATYKQPLDSVGPATLGPHAPSQSQADSAADTAFEATDFALGMAEEMGQRQPLELDAMLSLPDGPDRLNVLNFIQADYLIRLLGYGLWWGFYWLFTALETPLTGAQWFWCGVSIVCSAGLWPHWAKYWVTRQPSPLRAEQSVLLVDSILVGLGVAVMGFSVWFSFGACTMVWMVGALFRGKTGLIEAMLATAAGSMLALLWVDLPFDYWQQLTQDPYWGLHGLSFLCILAFILGLSISVHNQWDRLRQSERQLFRNERLLRNALEDIHSRHLQLHEKVIHDDLTGLYNRGYFDDVLWRECKRMQRQEGNLAVFMVDIDHFKSVNDRYGHLVGDKVLKRVAHLLPGCMREADVVCRWGGEEFAVMMSDITLDVALQRAEECRKIMEEMQVRHAGITLQNTVSMGVALYPGHAASAEALVAVADRCLYAVKAAGRNGIGYEAADGEVVLLRYGLPFVPTTVATSSKDAKVKSGAKPNVLKRVAVGSAAPNSKLATQRYFHGRQRDALTGLMSAAHFNHTGRKLLQNWLLRGQAGALFILNIDNFQQVNDTMGHRSGDELIFQTAQRLSERQVHWPESLLARGLSGDSFTLMLAYEPQDHRRDNDKLVIEQWIEQQMQELQACMGPLFDIGEGGTHRSASIGAAVVSHVWESGDITMESLLRHADIAVHEAKRNGKGQRRIYQPSMLSALRYRAHIEADLKQVVQRNELRYYIQPQVDESGQLIGGEALLRWQHSTRGMIFPSDFITLAEKTEDIYPMGAWMLQNTCDTLKRWADHPLLSNVTISVNVSAHQLLHPDFVHDVQTMLAGKGVPLQHLKFEITETMLIDDPDPVLEKMHVLREMGLRFSLDDFGVGYSSLSYLRKLPIDEVKVDRSFVQHILHNERDAAIANTIFRLAHTLQLDVVAEGVESEAQRDALVSMSCRKFQGYFFARPMAQEQFERLADWLCLHQRSYGKPTLHTPELSCAV